jgi:23S rRNA (adenine2503-C2)-methyltransferase
VINHIKVDTMQRSEDGTVKKRGIVRWFGGRIGFDSYEYQNNCLCSSQVGCSLDCCCAIKECEI